MNRTLAERPLAYYQTAKGEKLRVSEVSPTADNQAHTELLATGMWRVLRRGYAAKYEQNILSAYEIGQILGSPEQQTEKLSKGRRAARYFITALGDEAVQYAYEVRSVLRVEQQLPFERRPGNWTRRPHPNITDLETRSGRLTDGPYQADAIALAAVALGDMNPRRKISAHVAAANTDGIRFFEMIGMTLTDYVDSTVGSRRMADDRCRPAHFPYAHMEAQKAATAQQALEAISQPYIPDI